MLPPRPRAVSLLVVVLDVEVIVPCIVALTGHVNRVAAGVRVSLVIGAVIAPMARRIVAPDVIVSAPAMGEAVLYIGAVKDQATRVKAEQGPIVTETVKAQPCTAVATKMAAKDTAQDMAAGAAVPDTGDSRANGRCAPDELRADRGQRADRLGGTGRLCATDTKGQADCDTGNLVQHDVSFLAFRGVALRGSDPPGESTGRATDRAPVPQDRQ